MLSTVHLLLTYKCPLRCDHCFVYGNSKAKGTFTGSQLHKVLEEAAASGSVRWIVFEGGEPFLVYPLLLRGIHQACQLGFDVAVLTNGFFARSEESATRFLKPLQELGISRLYVSDDTFHYKALNDSPAKRAIHAASKMNLPVSSISISQTAQNNELPAAANNRQPGLDARLRYIGRAAERLTAGRTIFAEDDFVQCPIPNLADPERVSIDAYGNVQICPGISIGNIKETPLRKMFHRDKMENHPIWRALVDGGPALLSRKFPIEHLQSGYVHACHLCFSVRRALIDRFPAQLVPRNVYGIS